MMRKLTYSIVTSLAMGALATSAHAAVLYAHGITFSGSEPLYRIDTVAQTAAVVGTDVREAGPELQLDPIGNRLIRSGSDGNGGDGDLLVFIDPATGLNTGTLTMTGFPNEPPPGTDVTDTATALEFVGSTLYGSFHEGGPENVDGVLGTINLTTGAITEIGPMTGMNRPTGGLALVPGGTMYAVSSTNNNDSRLFTVNLSTGAATLVAPITLGGLQLQNISGLAYQDGVMYATSSNTGITDLYRLDLTTGELTVEFDMGVDVNNLASSTAIPEPASLVLLSLSGLMLLARDRAVSRRRQVS